jgi:hypothetical protein
MAVTLNANTSTGFIATSDTSGVLQLQTAGTAAVTVDASQNVGIGTASPVLKLDVSGKAKVTSMEIGVSEDYATNLYYSGGWKYRATGYGTTIGASSGAITFSNTASSGTADASATVSERMRIASTGEVTYTATTLASYQWNNWNPTNTTGTITNAPSTGTADDSNYVTMANASGTLTITFDIAGKYFVCITQQTQHSQTYTVDRITAVLGGTTARRVAYNPTNSGIDSTDQNLSISTGFYVVATAAQTLTILPTYELTGAGTTAQHIAACNVTIQYCGG